MACLQARELTAKASGRSPLDVNGLNQVRKVKELADTCTAMQHESLFLAGRQHSEPYGVILELEILQVTKEMFPP